MNMKTFSTEFTRKRLKRSPKCSNSIFSVVKCSKLKYVEEYCENSSIHGFRYFSMKDIHGFERFWWILSVVLSMIGCCMLINYSYEKWDESPVIVTFSEKMTRIHNIPFPAVTICPEIKAKKEIFNFTGVLKKFNSEESPFYGLTENEFRQLSTNFQICDKEKFESILILSNWDEITINATIFDSIKLMAPDVTESLFLCKFATRVFECEDYFQNIITDDGLCFTFNSLTYEEMFHNGSSFDMSGDLERRVIPGRWTMEDGYDNVVTDTGPEYALYPHRLFSAGLSTGLTILLGVREADVDYLCRGSVQGFKVTLHPPNELPDVSGQHFRIPIEEDVRVAIKPNVLVTSKSLQNYSPTRRQCYFNSERKLRFMKSYTQQNCYMECIANYTLRACNCVKFSMPRDEDTPICGTKYIACYIMVEQHLLEDAGSKEPAIDECDCLPACTSISYDAQMSSTKHEFQKVLEIAEENSTELDGITMAQLSIFYKELQFISSKRSELIGMTDFVAACGGLLGLFLGISLLSIVEFVYYFSLRLLCSFRSTDAKVDPEKVVTHGKRKAHDRQRKFVRSSNYYW